MAKYTKGPWVAKPADSGAEPLGPGWCYALHGHGWWNMAHVVVRMEDDDDENPEGLANARLISAAPDLLEALRQTWEVIDAAGLIHLSRGVQLGPTVWYVKACDARDASLKAIAKAEGNV